MTAWGCGKGSDGPQVVAAENHSSAKQNSVSAETSQRAAVESSADMTAAAAPEPRGRVALTPIGRLAHGSGFATSAAEISAYDAASQRLFVVNVERRSIDIVDFSDPAQLTLAGSLDVAAFGVPTSVAARDGLIAASVAPVSKRDRGTVVFLDSEGRQLTTVAVGHEPDMLTFSPDGRWLVVANEGEPEADYSFDPVGSISRIDVSAGAASVTADRVVTFGFESFNDRRGELDPSVRIFGPGASVAQDLEPEYITISPDSQTAWVGCQENNCVAIVDLATPAVTRIIGLGFKDHSQPGNGLDASDKDGGIHIRPWPVRGMYQPDGMACWTAGDTTYVLTANDGKDRDTSGFSERTRIKDVPLDPTAFPDADELQRPENLGRLRVTKSLGDTDGDGRFEELYSFGGRSFSIWTADFEQIFDSGDQFERITAAQLPAHFNSDHESHNFDNRSDAKGPEPEGVAIGRIGEAVYAFIGLERVGGVLVYDVTDPQSPVFETYANPRDVTADAGAETGGDLGPEGVLFISAEDSPNGRPLLVVAHEVSGTIVVFEISVSGASS